MEEACEVALFVACCCTGWTDDGVQMGKNEGYCKQTSMNLYYMSVKIKRDSM